MQESFPESVVHVGTQINGVPHIGTIATHAAAFAVAEKIREDHGISTSVSFTALDNAPVKSLDRPRKRDGSMYQICAAHAVQSVQLDAYEEMYESYASRTGVPYEINTYSEQQESPLFRSILSDVLEHPNRDFIAATLDPKDSRLKVRVPDETGYAQKDCSDSAITEGVYRGLDIEDNEYSASIMDAQFVDTNTMLRNLIKEVALARDDKKLHVVLKGSDWSLGTPLVDRAASALGQPAHTLPTRVFSPLILDHTGAKLAKSNMSGSEIAEMKSIIVQPQFLAGVMGFMQEIVEAPRDFLRNYTVNEFIALTKGK